MKDQRKFKQLKIILILAAALIPFLSGFQFSYSTCEALRHEKFLFLAKAGPYAGPPIRVWSWRNGSNRSCRRSTQNGRRGKNMQSD
jgi:hypothetical protein